MSESETEKTGDESETVENVEDIVTTTRTYIEGGYENFSIGFWEGMEIGT
jgi:hypothetical protein